MKDQGDDIALPINTEPALREINEKWRLAALKAAKAPENQLLPKNYGQRCKEWFMRDFWSAHEAANLLVGCDPERQLGLPGHEALDNRAHQLVDAIKRSELRTEGRMKKLYVAKDVLRWAEEKAIRLPEPLCEAMGIPAAEQSEEKKIHGNSLVNAQKREEVMGAAFLAMMRYRHQCLGVGGKFNGAQIARILESNVEELFGKSNLPMEAPTMAKLINSYLGRIPKDKRR
ncbi:hypothetical protein J2T57_001194 [Natronocella acetinitrilica]|uniref:Uncharacterized protein n=1 Tax=Natronocella acetinitrilica TaxID=414046 RepID=A0AAE3G1I4_9GAMM|nr:hypothetical protein [Natronocella acetinitrilica]MCP1674095.1 hypothetical protein [Natronocella acetinitrilica]